MSRLPRCGAAATLNLPIRCTQKERDRWKAAARAKGVTLAQVARQAWDALADVVDAKDRKLCSYLSDFYSMCESCGRSGYDPVSLEFPTDVQCEVCLPVRLRVAAYDRDRADDTLAEVKP